jgi:subtilisin-like proprotein convertase family protein
LRRLSLLAPLALIALLALTATSPAATSIYTSHQLHTAIPDVGSVTSSIAVPDSGPASFIAVGVRIAHPRDSDLTLTLTSPRGRKVVLSAGQGGAAADYGSGAKGCSGNLAWFESDALDPVSTQTAPFAGEQRPMRPLTSLDNEPAHGRWSLRVDDGTAGASGQLLCWQLELSRNVVDEVHAARGDVSADLSYRETKSFYSDLRISVRRHGVRLLSTPVARLACHDCAVSGYNTLLGPSPLAVRDLDGDGEPEVLLDLYTGGAHCCFYTVILRFDGSRYRGSVAFWGDPGYSLRDLNGDGPPEFLTADDRFAYAFTSYAGSALPVQVRRYDHGALTDVTDQYLYLVRSDARSLWQEYLKDHAQPEADMRGLLAGWLADEYRLGQQDAAWKQIEAAYSRGELSAPRVDPVWPAGLKYLRALRAFLVKTGYAR